MTSQVIVEVNDKSSDCGGDCGGDGIHRNRAHISRKTIKTHRHRWCIRYMEADDMSDTICVYPCNQGFIT